MPCRFQCDTYAGETTRESDLMILRRSRNRTLSLFALALACGSCAPLQPPSANGPRGEAEYPLVITEDQQRREVAIAAANQLFQPPTAQSQPTLQPVTATIASLPTGHQLYLPKLGVAPVMTEEETRESLRRFLRDWRGLIGADPAKLSLVERVDAPDGTKIANYEQRPFRYPIRGKYGKVHIRFATDRRVLNLSSTSIPDAERLQPLVAALVPKLTAEDAEARIREKAIPYTNTSEIRSTFNLTPANEVTARDLVLYILPDTGNPNELEFHLTWEIEIAGGPAQRAYLDAISGDVIAAE
jgi:hypothetical protein